MKNCFHELNYLQCIGINGGGDLFEDIGYKIADIWLAIAKSAAKNEGMANSHSRGGRPYTKKERTYIRR